MRRLPALLVLGGLFCASTAWADAFHLLGFDADSMAVGGALTGGAAGPAAVYYNPAALNKNHKQESQFTYFWLKPKLQIDRDSNEKLAEYLGKSGNREGDESRYYNVISFKDDVNDFQERRAERVPLVRGYSVGLVVPLGEDRAEAPAAFGLGLFIPQGPIMRQRINAPETPYFVEFDDRSQRIVINAGLAYDITNRIHVGGGASFLADIPVQVDMFVPINFNVVDVVLKGNTSAVNVGVTPLAQIEVTPVIAPNAGVLFEPLDNLSFGATYRDEIQAKVDAKASIVAETGTGRTTSLPAEISASAAFTPRQVALGTKYKPIEKLTLYGDATWAQWSHYRPPVAEFSVSNIRQLVTEVLHGSGISDLGLLGSEIEFGGQPIKLPSEQEILELVPDYVRVKYEFKGFRNTWTPRLGASYELNEAVTLMGGYFYRPTIEDDKGFRVTRIVNFGGDVTRTRLNQNTLDNDQHGLTAGASYKWRNFKVGLAAVYVQLVEKKVDKANDLTITYPDESPQIGTQTTAYGYPGYSYGGHMVGGLAQAAVSF